jgi:hypothetical protein
LLSCIGVESLPEFEHHGHALLRGHAAIFCRIGGIRFAEAVKNLDYLLHPFYPIVLIAQRTGPIDSDGNTNSQPTDRYIKLDAHR